ncbi:MULTISPECIES: chemotaxis protein CheW [Caulobacter]|jgi:purine-binding chemotaxis protein CheW|uniref:Chemotaxis signal transduction protein n=1 Tax=Caulobacter vibrioides OR37 TaxID=1292034 RepID=R0EN08_CAUVI|nr:MULTISPECIES: chemotaxis protein CheW [Caulobacter]ENZ83239.1 chemotaxis signal transduction protein [Caulobacter vibrioides OR37]MBQ1559820.1 chemotaxis protein CheW [Caulobacter sp.]
MIADNANDPIEALTFDLHGETFALEAGLVREVLDLLPETAVPGAPPFVGAVINFRGRVIPLVDLRVAFELDAPPPTIDSRIVVIEHPLDGEPTLIGLRADKVHEVTAIDRAVTEDAPRVGLKWRADFIRFLARRNGDVIVIPDLEQIFAARGQTAVVTPLHPSQS